jgi:hypothetical protein
MRQMNNRVSVALETQSRRRGRSVHLHPIRTKRKALVKMNFLSAPGTERSSALRRRPCQGEHATASGVLASGSHGRHHRSCARDGLLRGLLRRSGRRARRCQHQQVPDFVERNGSSDRAQEHAGVDGVAREAVGSAPDDGGGRQNGGDIRTGPGDGNDGPGGKRQREASTIAPSHPPGRWVGRNGQGTSQLSASAAMTASPHASGGRIMT